MLCKILKCVGFFSILCYRILQVTTTQGKKKNNNKKKLFCNHKELQSHRYHWNSLSVPRNRTSWDLLECERALQQLKTKQNKTLQNSELLWFTTLMLLNHFPSTQDIMLISHVLLVCAVRILRNLKELWSFKRSHRSALSLMLLQFLDCRQSGKLSWQGSSLWLRHYPLFLPYSLHVLGIPRL